MRLPKRKSVEDKRALTDHGPIPLTAGGIRQLEKHIADIDKRLPELRKELGRTAEMGDLSENAAYQIAKHAVRRNEGRLFYLKQNLKRVVLIEENKSDGIVRLGSTVTFTSGKIKQTFQLVGPSETNPSKGRISHISTLGNTLLGTKKGEKVCVPVKGVEVCYTIVDIS
jgi:transcription elongation factor GreA